MQVALLSILYAAFDNAATPAVAASACEDGDVCTAGPQMMSSIRPPIGLQLGNSLLQMKLKGKKFQKQATFNLSDSAWHSAQNPSHLLLREDNYKLLFCMVPKNACSEFLSLVMRLHGLAEEHWNPTAHGHSQADVHFDSARESMFFKAADRAELQRILADDGEHGWVRAVFLRDPVERLVSAYKSKVQTGYYGNQFPSNLTLEELIEALEVVGIDELTEPHLRPQSLLCGLNGTIGQYDFVGHFDNLQADARHLVEMLDGGGQSRLASEMLDHGWGPFKNQSLFGVPREVREAGGEAMMVTHSSALNDLQLNAVGQFRARYAGHALQSASRHRTAANGAMFWSSTGSEYDEAYAKLIQKAQSNFTLKARIQRLYKLDYQMIARVAKNQARNY